MERLTCRYEENHAVPTKFDLDFAFKTDDEAWAGLTEIFDHLSTYEDTGLTPEEILALTCAEDQQIATLKRALELSCQELATGYCCPFEFNDYECEKCKVCTHHDDEYYHKERDSACWKDYFTKKAQEKEGDS